VGAHPDESYHTEIVSLTEIKRKLPEPSATGKE